MKGSSSLLPAYLVKVVDHPTFNVPTLMHATDGPDNVKSARRIPARPHQMLLNGWMFTTQEIRSKTTRVSKPDSGKHRYKKDSDLDNTS